MPPILDWQFLLRAQPGHVIAEAGSSVWSADVPTWLTGVGTAVLAIFAIITAVYAVRAYRKQSQEVKDQADMLEVQSSRLGLQERQFEEQRKINQKRDALLDKQIRESEQRARTFERQQAEAIDLKPGSTMRKVPGYDLESQGRAHDADVFNESRRPIRNVACRVEASPGEGPQEARLVGLYSIVQGIAFAGISSRPDKLLFDAVEASIIPLMRAGESGSFVFAVSAKQDPDAGVTLRFTDDAGLHWQIDHDLHLEKLDNRDDW